MFEIGTQVRVKDAYPMNATNPNKQDIETRGKTGTVVRGYTDVDIYVSVLLDENKFLPDAWGLFKPEELEVVENT